MAVTKRKILIVEDDYDAFQSISIAITDRLSKWVDVYPHLDGEPGTIENFHYLKEEYILMNKFDEILSLNKAVDLYIIDVFLKDEVSSEDGFDLERKIKSQKTGNYPEVIVISSYHYVRDGYIWKRDNYQAAIVKKILELFPEIKDALSKDEDLELVRPSFIGRVKANYKLNGGYDTVEIIVRELDRRLRDAIHAAIVLSFYFLIIITTWCGVTNIYYEFFHSNSTPKYIQFLASIFTFLSKPKENADMEILDHAENIFIYLLPIFIVFGFYIYYITNTRIYFFKGKIGLREREASTHSMNLTKSIFVSSIISYTMIKVINVIFFRSETNIATLIAIGIFLLILLIYFMIVNKHGQNIENE